ncbi:MAG: hypothetical protein FJ271_25990 [Planctomycetes bacterium]|nr:hypothetical protein [Planctomycetota bacterium]
MVSDAFFPWLLVALGLGLSAGWSLSRSATIRLCRRIAQTPGALDRVFSEDALIDTRGTFAPQTKRRPVRRRQFLHPASVRKLLEPTRVGGRE